MPEGLGPPLCQLLRIALGSGGGREPVCLVHEDIPHRFTAQIRGTVGPDNCQAAAGKSLHGDGVGRIPASGLEHLLLQRRTGVYHGGDTPLGIILRYLVCGLDIQHRSRVVVDGAAHHVQLHFGFAYLSRSHDHDLPDPRLGKGIHDLPLIRRPVCPPGAGLRAALADQHPVFIRPFRDGLCPRRAKHGESVASQLRKRHASSPSLSSSSSSAA